MVLRERESIVKNINNENNHDYYQCIGHYWTSEKGWQWYVVANDMSNSIDKDPIIKELDNATNDGQ